MKKISKFLLPVILALVMVLMTTVSYAQPDSALRRYNPAVEGVQSGYLCINQSEGLITGIAPGTTVEQLNKLSLPGDLAAEGEAVGTGTVLTSATAGSALTVVVTGDINGDADISIADMMILKAHILGTELSGVEALAGDVNADGDIGIADFLGVKSVLLGLNEISFAPSDRSVEQQILAPGEIYAWQQAGASYVSDNETLVTISAEGVLTAGAVEGTTFVYAMDESGAVIARTAVTVLEGGVQVSLTQEAYTVSMEQSITLKAVLNHPVDVVVSWETSDSAICSITQEGVLTGHTYGDAVVRATLPNGTYTEAAVKVMPPITDMEIERTLYKVKPGATRALNLVLTPAENGEQIIWTSSNPNVVTVDENGVVTGVTKGTATITATGKYSGLKASCDVKICDVIQVAITFDDGPSSYTPKLLDFLQENDIKATFFIVGNRISSYKSTTQRIVNEGHELGYHSYSHKNHRDLTTAKIQSDFKTSCEIVEELTGATFTLWRAPGGAINSRVLDAIDLPHIMWTVDTLDWKYRNVDHVYNAILKNSDDGEIILLHDLHKTSVEGAIKAMKVMQEGDYEFLTVTELLSRNGSAPKNNTSYSKAPK